MSTFWEGIVTIGLAFITLGTIAVVVSKNAQTPAVIQSAASGFGNVLGVAESPVTGSQYNINLGYPGMSSAGQDFTGSFGFG